MWKDELVWHRALRFDSSEDFADDDDLWTSLKGPDYVHLGFTSFYQLLVLLAVGHLWKCRSWPPYCVRQISLVCLTGLAGVVAFLGTLIASGAVNRHDGDLVAHCGFVSLFDYTAWGVWISVALVRVYRSWKMLVKHSVDMWPSWGQVALLTLPWLTPVFVYTIDEGLSLFNERRNWCEVYEPVDTALYVYGCVPVVCAFVFVYQMRKVRKQMNEYRLQVFQLLFVLVTGTVVFPLEATWLDTNHETRRIWVLYHNVIASLVLFWPPVMNPIYRYLIGDQEYLNSYTKGFSTLPTPAQMRSSFRDQLSLEQLREEFEKFAELRVARELPDFYKACLERDEIVDFFARQAATSAIIDRFIRPGAEQEVNIDGDLRDKILSTEISSYNIFNEAMTAAVAMMDTNFSVAFKGTEAYRQLELNVKKEAEELERLKQMRQLPAKDHVQAEPRGLLKAIRRMLPAELSSSDGRGSDSRCGSSEGRTSSLSNLNLNRRARIGTHDGDGDDDDIDIHSFGCETDGGGGGGSDDGLEEGVALDFPPGSQHEGYGARGNITPRQR